MDDIIIRKANTNDLASIQKLNQGLFILEHDNYDTNLIINWPFEEAGTKYFTEMINNNIVFIAETSNEIVGYLAGNINVKNSYIFSKQAELENMFILEQYRKLGIGKLLIDEFKKECIDNGVENILVTASSKNINAIDFYKKQGFENYNTTLMLKI